VTVKPGPSRAAVAVRLLVLAKAPVVGRVKTRLCPPCTPDEAAALAEAALVDTLEAVAATPALERVLVLDGEPGTWLPPGFTVVAQRGKGLAERLAAAFVDVGGGSALLVAMDTPQLSPVVLTEAAAALVADGVDAVLGPAVDGGYWAIGLRAPAPDPGVFAGVPMSTAFTCEAQRRRLSSLGLRWVELPVLRDVDDIDDARAVAAEAPGTHFRAALERVLGP
jgi:uncharacterized protein